MQMAAEGRRKSEINSPLPWIDPLNNSCVPMICVHLREICGNWFLRASVVGFQGEQSWHK